MKNENCSDQLDENGSEVKGLLRKIYLLGSVIVLLTYGKIVWPLIFGRMHNENITFIEAASDASLHSTAFILLVLAIVIGFAWMRLSSKEQEEKE